MLSPQVSEPEEEWQRFEEGVSLATAKTVGVQGLVRRNRLGLSSDTLALVAAKCAAHLAWLSYAGSFPACKSGGQGRSILRRSDLCEVAC